MQKNRFSNISIVFIAFVVVFLSNKLEISQIVDNSFYGYCNTAKNVISPAKNHVLLVKNSSQSTPEKWQEILEFIANSRARAIVFCNAISNAQQARLPEFRYVFFPVNIAQSGKIRPGILTAPIGVRGEYYKQYYHRGDYPTLEAQLAETLLQEKYDLQEFCIHFAKPFGLPNVEFRSFERNEIIEELVRDKVIVFGRGDSEISTPVGQMSLLEFRGNTINSLLEKRFSIELSTPGKILLLILCFFSVFLVLRKFGYLVPTLLVLFFYTVALIACEMLLGFRMPYNDFVLLTLILLIASLHKKIIFSRDFSQDLTYRLQSNSSLRNSSQTSSELWVKIVNMIQITFQANRIIFIEKSKKSKFFTEAISVNCSLQDVIPEYQNSSYDIYNLSVEKGVPVTIPNFFTSSLPNEELFLVPIVFLNEVLAFGILGIDINQQRSIAKFHLLLEQYGKHISEIYYIHKNRAILTGYQRFFLEKNYQDLNDSVTANEQYVNNLETLFNSGHYGSVVYNIFGDIILCNSRALRIFEEREITPYKTSLLETLCTFLGCEELQAKTILCSVLLEHQKISIPIEDHINRRFTFNIWPLLQKKENPHSHLSPITGIVCEFIEETLFAKLSEIQENVLEKIGLTLRNELTALSLSVSLLESSPEQISMLSDIIKQRINNATDVINSCEEFVKLDRFTQDNNAVFPINLESMLEKIQKKLVKELRQKSITISVQQPKLLPAVLASFHLEKVFCCIVKLLLKDAKDDSNINISIKTPKGRVEYHFCNSGFGMTPENFQECLYGTEKLDSSEFLDMRKCLEIVQDWGAKLEASSKVGEGTKVSLHLLTCLQ